MFSFDWSSFSSTKERNKPVFIYKQQDLCVEKTAESFLKALRTGQYVSNVSGYKMDIQKSIAYVLATIRNWFFNSLFMIDQNWNT